jgi:hypothetical protein
MMISIMRSRSLFGLDLHAWEQIMLWSLGGAALAALAVVISTTSVVLLQREEVRQSEERISAANARAAEAQLALEKFKAPRLLNPDAIQRIVEQLKPFSGSVFDAGIGPKGDPEPTAFLRGLTAALTAAGWKFVPWTGEGETYTEAPMPPIGLTAVTNVIIDVHPDFWSKFGRAATALARALNDEDISAIVDSEPTRSPPRVPRFSPYRAMPMARRLQVAGEFLATAAGSVQPTAIALSLLTNHCGPI